LVEGALMLPIFFLLVFAIIEFGAAYGDKLGASNAVTSGTRTASAGGNDGFADYFILQQVVKSSSAITRGSIEYVVVFKAAGVDSVPTATCRNGTPDADQCNVYSPSEFAATKAEFGCQSLDLDKNWCPSTRKTSQTLASGGPPDYIGVYIKVVHTYYTGFFGKSVTLTDQAIIQIEPRQL
jgi:Flp pilus assembly protein TadG